MNKLIHTLNHALIMLLLIYLMWANHSGIVRDSGIIEVLQGQQETIEVQQKTINSIINIITR